MYKPTADTKDDDIPDTVRQAIASMLTWTIVIDSVPTAAGTYERRTRLTIRLPVAINDEIKALLAIILPLPDGWTRDSINVFSGSSRLIEAIVIDTVQSPAQPNTIELIERQNMSTETVQFPAQPNAIEVIERRLKLLYADLKNNPSIGTNIRLNGSIEELKSLLTELKK